MGDFQKGHCMKKHKLFLKYTAAALALAQLLPVAADSAYPELTPITVIPENVLNVQVTDTAGNPINGVTIKFHNGANEYVGNVQSGVKFNRHYGSWILDCTEKENGEPRSYSVPWSRFEALVAPDKLHTLYRGDKRDDIGWWVVTEPTSMVFDEGQTSYFRLGSCPVLEKSNLIVEAGQWAFCVDGAWAEKSVYGYLRMDGNQYYFTPPEKLPDILAGSDSFPLNAVQTYTAPADGDLDLEVGLMRLPIGSGMYLEDPEISDTATEYVCCRMYVPDLFPSDSEYFCNGDATFTIDGRVYDFAKDTAETAAMLVIRSGSVLTVPVPDENGYVEFYLDKNSRECHATAVYHYTFDNGAGGGGSWFVNNYIYGGPIQGIAVTGAYLPDTGVNMVNVPADTYTLSYENIPRGYSEPQTTSVTVADSQEIQSLHLVLERAFLPGDVNDDEQINAADAAVILSAAAAAGSGNASVLNAEQKQAADVNADGAFNATDAALILQYAAYAGAGGKLSFEEFLKS